MCPKRLRCKLAPRSTSRAVEVAGMMTEMKLGMSAVSAAVADREVGRLNQRRRGGRALDWVLGELGPREDPREALIHPGLGWVCLVGLIFLAAAVRLPF